MISQVTPDAIGGIISSLGVVGALVWYLYHNTTKTIPEMQQRYLDSQKEIVAIHTASHERISDEFARTLAEEREYRKQEITQLKTWIETEASCKYNRDHAG